MNTVAIIGAGPAGLAAAMKIKELGFDATVFEEHETIGEPTHCSGLLSRRGVEELGLNLSDCLQNEIRGARIFSPSGHKLEIKLNKTVAYVVDRKKLDQTLLRRARLLGVHVATSTKLIDVRNNTLFVQSGGRGELRKAEYIIGADGVSSTVRHIMGINIPKENYIHTMQATLSGEFDDKMVELHIGDHSKGFFSWVIPISKEKAKVGMGSNLGEDVSTMFKSFVKQRLPDARIHGAISALIPCGNPLGGITNNNMALVGDAAFQTKATTGGGIIFGIRAGNILGEVMADVLKGKAKLSDYEKKMEGLNKELKLHYKIHKYSASLSNKEVDELFIKLKKKGIEEFLAKNGDMDEPANFVSKLATNPRFFFMTGTIMKFLMS